MCGPFPPGLGHPLLLLLVFCFNSMGPWARPSKCPVRDPLVPTLGFPAWGSAADRSGESPLAPKCARGGAVKGRPHP